MPISTQQKKKLLCQKIDVIYFIKLWFAGVVTYSK